MMFKLSSNLTLSGQEVDFVTDIEIRSSWETLTDRAEVEFPRGVRFISSRYIASLDALFKLGDPAILRFGYNGENRLQFIGRIAAVNPGDRIKFDLEDEMYLLKQTTVEKYSKKSVTLAQLLSDLCPVPFECEDIDLGQFRIKNSNLAQVLESIRKTYGLYSWAREGKIYAGFAYRVGEGDRHIFEVSKNVVSSKDLTFLTRNDVKIKIKAVSLQPDNKKIQVEAGDPDGDIRTVFKYNVNESALKQYAEAMVERFKYDGYRGSFIAFQEPAVKHGDTVVFRDPFIPEREGEYLVKKVVKRFGASKDEQVITLDRRVDEIS